MKQLLFSLTILCSLFVTAQENQGFVAARTGLNIREKPETNAKVLGKIPYAIMVSWDDATEQGKPINTEGFNGSWRKVTYDGKTGYIIDTYLLPFTPPKAGTQTMKEYIVQISGMFGDSLLTRSGNEEVGSTLIKQLYKNGVESHEFLGYEYNSMTWFIPGLTIQQAFVLIRLLPEFADYIGEKDEFITSNKKIKKKGKEYEYKVEKEVFGNTPWINRIKIGFEDGAIYDFELFQIDNQVVIFYGAGV